MLKLIIEKELRDIIGSTRFVVTFAACAVLILLAFFTGARNHLLRLEQYEAARAANLRQMAGLTDWLQVERHRVFLPPRPLEALVSGVCNDIGRTIEVVGRGELSTTDSRYGNEPVYAVFRFLDLNFIFQIVLSLFAMLFGYDAINGEKERGTLRLVFSNAIPRTTFILGKLIGAFVAIAVPLLLAILLGCLILPLAGLHLSGDEWLRLALVVLAGMLYFGAFLTLAILVSTLTSRSVPAFLSLLIIWIFIVLIIPRISVLIAGRSVDVSTVDEMAAQKSKLRRQLWQEDRSKLAGFQPAQRQDVDAMMREFQEFMQELSDRRYEKMQALARQLNEVRRNKQQEQERLAFGLARLSPAATFALAADELAGNGIDLKAHFLAEAQAYQKSYAAFMLEKTGMAVDGRQMRFRTDDNEARQPIDPRELPEFDYDALSLRAGLQDALPEMGLLLLFNLIFFSSAFVRFMRYALR